MAKLQKIKVYNETIKKTIEAHTAYSNGSFMVILDTEYVDYAKSLGPQGFEGKRYGFQKLNKKNVFQVYQWYSMGKDFTGIVGSSEANVIERWKAFIVHFYEQIQDVEKVILYRVGFSSIKVNPGDRYYDDLKSTFEKDDDAYRSAYDADSDSNAAKISFDFIVCEKRSIGNKSAFYFIDKNNKTDRIDGSWHEMPFSVEAEAFFSDIYNGLEGIMEKLSKFIGSPKRALKSIETAQKLLA